MANEPTTASEPCHLVAKKNWRDYVGRFHVEVELTNNGDLALVRGGHLPPEQVRRTRISGLVDTGATQLVLPPSVVSAPGLPETGQTVTVQFADNRRERRAVVTDVRLEHKGRWGIFNAIVEPGRTDCADRRNRPGAARLPAGLHSWGTLAPRPQHHHRRDRMTWWPVLGNRTEPRVAPAYRIAGSMGGSSGRKRPARRQVGGNAPETDGTETAPTSPIAASEGRPVRYQPDVPARPPVPIYQPDAPARVGRSPRPRACGDGPPTDPRWRVRLVWPRSSLG